MSENTQNKENIGEEMTAEQTVDNCVVEVESVAEDTETTEDTENIESKEKPKLSRYPMEYFVIDGNLYFEEVTSKGSRTVFVSNFTPYISKVITYDDGITKTNKYAVRGEVAGERILPEVIVDNDEILNLNWIARLWDTECNIGTSFGAKDKLRFALQATTPATERLMYFTTTGWQATPEGLKYLLPGNEKYPIRLEGKLHNYYLETCASDDDVRTVFEIYQSNFIPRNVLLPCMALAFLSPLNTLLRIACCEPKFILMLVGRTGSFKSTVTALMMSFFGFFTEEDLPMSFHDTVNSITQKAFILKDVLSCVDDYHPTSGNEVAEMNRVMQCLARAVGDLAGRGRLDSKINLQPSYPPQGNVIVTAEHIPDIGESGIARCFITTLNSGDVDPRKLSEVQDIAANGVLQRVMSDYVEFMQECFFPTREKFFSFIDTLTRDHKSFRDECRHYLKEQHIRFHGRTADTVASLRIGYMFMMSFLHSRLNIDWDTQGRLDKEFNDIIYNLAVKQSATVNDDRPTHIFIRKLLSLVECGENTILPEGYGEEPPKGCLGYQDEQYYYLFLDQCHKAVKRLCDSQQENFPISSQALAKALAEEKFIEVKNGCNTTPKRFGNRKCRVMFLRKDAVKQVYDTDDESA